MNWAQAKAKALQRDGRCLRCGLHDTLDVHHRRARGAGGTKTKDRLANLITLCRTCHEQIEAMPVLARWFGYRLDAGDDPAATPAWLRTVNGTGWWLLHDDATLTWLHDGPRP